VNEVDEEDAKKWSADKVDGLLHEIMTSIHEACVDAAQHVDAEGDLAAGANIAGFIKVADAMIAQGAV